MIRFDKATGEYWIPHNDHAIETMLDNQYERLKGELRWRPRKGFIEAVSKAVSFIQTVTSGFAPESEVVKRTLACFGDGKEQPKCPGLITDTQGSYCGGCKCGTWQLANLDGSLLPKLSWSNLRCPLGRF